MNGYKLMADSYRKLLNEKTEGYDKKDIEANIKVFDILATFEDNDKYIAFDSGMFNEIFKGYVELLVKDIDNEEIKKDIIDRSGTILDTVNSKQAEEYYKQV